METTWNLPAPDRLSAQDVLIKLRFKLSDTTVNKYSEQELLVALNEGMLMLWKELEKNYSSLTHKIVGYDLILGHGQLLPKDFSSLVKIQGTMQELRDINPGIFDTAPGNRERFPRIYGEHIVGEGSIRMVYNYVPFEVTLAEDTVDVPIGLVNDLVAITANIVTQNMDMARQRAAEAGQKTSQYREFARPPRKVAFP